MIANNRYEQAQVKLHCVEGLIDVEVVDLYYVEVAVQGEEMEDLVEIAIFSHLFLKV